MKNMIKLAVIGAVFAAAVAQTIAQDTNNTTQVTQTLNAQALNIALTGYTQNTTTAGNMTATKVRITNKDVLAALNGNAKAKIMVLNPVDFEGNPEIVFRTTTGKTSTDVDVSQWFAAQTVSVVENSKTDKNNKTTGTEYSIEKFTFGGTGDGAPTSSFDVQGFTQSTLANGAFNSTVNGTGVINGADAVLTGKITGTGGKHETRTVTVGG